MMSLKKIAKKSKINHVSIMFNGEEIKYNLYKEVLILDDSSLNKLMKSNTSLYSFLKALQVKLIAFLEEKEAALEELYASLFTKYKISKKTPYYKANFKFPSDDYTKNLVLSNFKYKKLRREAIKAKENKNIIDTSVRAFEHKKDLLQTLSANLRKEN